MLNVTIIFDGREGVIQYDGDSIEIPAPFDILGAINKAELVDEVKFAHLNPVLGFVRSAEGASLYELVNTLSAIGFEVEMDEETKNSFEDVHEREQQLADELVEY
ncbi:hypothetical protein AI2795V1_4756 (plasmid) [Serratia marcescens]|uniref:hypothetical protein n=1 Tax=Serratia marcescens TaxID=615 RepID=UPI001D87E487|nr:hypothetical protein [Serratia marcescens]CAE7798614.1 hypothetical protein AI2795V1_4756 [Serratia marcescens]CAH3933627.1 hypothetical protein AI2795V1_4756 [Serratia marcescens]